MKILACTDGSEQSRKALKEAAKIAECFNGEVTVIYVEDFIPYPTEIGPYFSEEFFRQLEERNKEDSARIIADAVKIFEEQKIQVKTILKKGHPSETVSRVASEGGFEMVVIGSRGLGGLKKLLLGSVSNAVAQSIEANVLIVK
ncbi:MAG: Stress response protein NhaX [Dehalococcoidia bacterium]|nr:Stress response protein NhaX [Bacillota bacterium]